MNIQNYDIWQYEAGLLAMCFMDESGAITDPESINPEWLSDGFNRCILAKLIEWRKLGGKFDVLTARDHFGKEGIRRLVDGTNVVSSITMWDEWLDYFKGKYYKLLLSKLVSDGAPPNETHEIVEKIAELRRGANNIKDVSMAGVIQQALADLELEMSGKSERFETGIPPIDNRLGFIRPGRLYMIGGRPGACKTNLSIQIMNHIISTPQKPSALYFTAEMSGSMLLTRMACMNIPFGSELSYSKVTEGKIDSVGVTDYNNIMTELNKYNGYFIETFRFNMPIVKKQLERFKARVMFVDYVQRFRLSDMLEENRAAAMSEIANTLKEIAMEHNIAVITMSQVNQKGELKESGGLYEAADAVILLSVEQGEGDSADKYIHVNIDKNRFGDTGRTKLKLDKKTLRLEGV